MLLDSCSIEALGSNTGMGFLRANDFQLVQKGECQFGLGAL